MKLLEHGIDNPPLEKIVVMVQKEVAERLCAPAGSPLYGAVTASASYYAKISRLFNVVSGNFMPRPKVDSAVICLEPYKKAPVDIRSHELFFKTIRGAFAQRRKTLSNSLSTEFSHLSKDTLTDVITRCGFDANIRGEKLSIDDFARLSNELFILSEKPN
jgi:16S rRNA (adenine1518-N6/adenine1519-N6)-dimethyltransferase